MSCTCRLPFAEWSSFWSSWWQWRKSARYRIFHYLLAKERKRKLDDMNRLFPLPQCLPQGVASFSRRIAASRGLTQLLSAWVVIILFVVACAPLVSPPSSSEPPNAFYPQSGPFFPSFFLHRCLWMKVKCPSASSSWWPWMVHQRRSSTHRPMCRPICRPSWPPAVTSSRNYCYLPSALPSLVSNFPRHYIISEYSYYAGGIDFNSFFCFPPSPVRHPVRPAGHDIEFRVPANDEHPPDGAPLDNELGVPLPGVWQPFGSL